MIDEHSLARADLRRWAELPDDEIDLAAAALAIAAAEVPELDVECSLATLDALADQARPRVQAASGEHERLRSLVSFLHEEAGFRGNLDAYYDPRNSFLNEVLERGLGIPITLAVVYIEVGKRLGMRFSGINFPGHFLLRYECEEPVYLDPFNPEQFMGVADCESLLTVMSEGQVRFEDRFLEAASSRQMLVRILKNLKLIHFREGELLKAVEAIDSILMLMPDQAPEYRDRGVAHLKLDDYRAALEDLTSYLALADHAPDRAAVQSTIDYLRLRLAPIN